MVDHGAEAAAEHGIKRSPHWPSVQHAHLLLGPHCRAGSSLLCPVKPQVHHVVPFHFCVLLGRPELELDQRNLISLCETEEGKAAPNHHLLLGHLDFFQSSNVDVRLDAVHRWFGKTAAQIQADPLWQAKSKHRMPSWGEMSDQAKRDLRALMDHLYPLARAA